MGMTGPEAGLPVRNLWGADAVPTNKLIFFKQAKLSSTIYFQVLP